MARSFERTGIKVDKVTRPGYKIVCAECGYEDSLVASNSAGSLPPDVTTRKFSQRGWTVGSAAKHDACPKCTQDKVLHRNKPAPSHQNVVPITPAIAVQPEAPREMSKEDRRIIFSAIHDVYLDESRGYDTGWNDGRIAADLNVPLAWVREIRDENFGPEGLSEADRAKLAAAEAFQNEILALARRADEIAALQAKLEADVQELASKFAPVARDVQDVRKAVARV